MGRFAEHGPFFVTSLSTFAWVGKLQWDLTTGGATATATYTNLNTRIFNSRTIFACAPANRPAAVLISGAWRTTSNVAPFFVECSNNGTLTVHYDGTLSAITENTAIMYFQAIPGGRTLVLAGP